MLKEFDILVEVKQKATAFNASGGIFRPERVSLGTPDLYEQIASSSSRQFAYKTVLIADCTIPNPFIDLRTFRYAVEFVQVLCARTKVYVWNGKEAILLNSQQVNQGEFAVLSQTLEPISPEALQRFRATHQLQLNNSIVLDHRNFQMMANVMGIGHTSYKKDSPRLDNIMLLDREDFEQKTIGPSHVSVKFINSMPPNTRSKFAATLQAQGQPLHLLIDFSNLSKMGEQHLAAIPLEFHEVIVYFYPIDSDFIEDFRKLMRNVPEAQLIGLIHLYDKKNACEESDALIAEMGDDFISRFGKIVHTSFDFRDEKRKVIPNDNMEVDIRRAEFYFDDPQQSFSEFAGKFEFNGEEIRYIPGWIERCVTDNIDEITLYNSPVWYGLV